MIKLHIVKGLLMVSAALILVSCAKIGSPEGGPRDFAPPQVVGTRPAQGTLHFTGKKVVIEFDELIQLKDQQKKVVVSPAQKTPPTIRTNGSQISVEFNDTLLANTTYSIDFSNAISDNNEGNTLDGYSFAFSTGDVLDSLQVSGMVFRARDLEPMQHVTVGLTTDMSDTVFTHTPLQRISHTNDRGQFTIHNLKPGRYQLFALRDVDGNNMLSANEDVAFSTQIVVPSTAQYQSTDTVFTYDRRVDTVVMRTRTDFLPNNLLLTMFAQPNTNSYLKKYQRIGRNRLLLVFAAAQPKLPPVEVLTPKGHATDWAVVEHTAANDSVVYWLTDSALISSDSLVLKVSYLKTIQTDSMAMVTDTLKMNARRSSSDAKLAKQHEKEAQQRAEDRAKLEQERAKLVAEGKDPADIDIQLRALDRAAEKARERLKLEVKQGTMNTRDSISFTSTVPIGKIDAQAVHLERFVPKDSSWIEVDIPPMKPASQYELMRYVLPMTLEPGTQYRFRLDTLAVTSIYGLSSDPEQVEIRVKGVEEYANLYLQIVNAPQMGFAELLNREENVVARALLQSSRVVFQDVEPGTYYVRLIDDRNGNGQWDTGNFTDRWQPEDVYYYPQAIRLRQNWNVDQTWNLWATPIDRQKPDEIKKNKPESTTDPIQRAEEEKLRREQEEKKRAEDDEFNAGGFGRGLYNNSNR